MNSQLRSIVVYDFGSQYTRLIARRLRELGVYSVIVGPHVPARDLAEHEPAGVILSGGPRSVGEPGAPGLPEGLIELGLPVLAVCYGMQLVARERGGRVAPAGRGEYGKVTLAEYGGRLFEGVEGEFVAWMSHGDSVLEAPPGFTVTAVSEGGAIAAMEDDASGVYCLQFHPEVRHTPKGSRLLERFVERTGAPRDWTPESIVQRAVEDVRERVGGERVLLAVSGGVDSSTLALLLTRAIGDRKRNARSSPPRLSVRWRMKSGSQKCLRPMSIWPATSAITIAPSVGSPGMALSGETMMMLGTSSSGP